jgi:hypothetical protein
MRASGMLSSPSWFKFSSVSLAKDKPSRLISKAGECVFLVGFFLTLLARDRHAKRQRALSTSYNAA